MPIGELLEPLRIVMPLVPLVAMAIPPVPLWRFRAAVIEVLPRFNPVVLVVLVPMLRVPAVARSRAGAMSEVSAVPVPEMWKLDELCRELWFRM